MKFLLALLAGASIAALPLAPARAQDGPPVPCNGMHLTDAAGDASYFDPTAPPTLVSPAHDNEDIRGLFFNYRGGVLTGNMVVQNLDKTETGAPYATASAWEIRFLGPADNEFYAATAKTDGAAWTFEMQTYDRVGTGQIVDPGMVVSSPIKGQAFEGPMGVLSLEIPVEGVKVGATLGDVYAYVSPREQFNQPGFFTDEAPDGGEKSYTIVECPAEQPAPDPTTGGTPPAEPGQQPPSPQPQPQPQPQPSPSPQGQPAPGSPLPATGTLSFDVAVDKGKRKTAVKRGLRGRVRCSVQCKVTATAKIDKRTARKLKLGRKAMKIGKGKGSIRKAGRIPFYVKLTKKAKRALKRRGVRRFALKVSFRVTDNQGKQVKKVTRKSTLR